MFLESLKKLIFESGFATMTWQSGVMLLVAFVLVYLAVVRKYEPLLLLPIAFGILLSNFPGANLYNPPLWEAYTQGYAYDVDNMKILYDEENRVEIPVEDYILSLGLEEGAKAPEILESVHFTDIIHHGGFLDLSLIHI